MWDDQMYREQVFKVTHPRRVCMRTRPVDSIYEPDPMALIYNNRVDVGPYQFQFRTDRRMVEDLSILSYRDQIEMRVREAVMDMSLKCEFETRKNYDHPTPVQAPATPKPTFGQPPVRKILK